MAAKILVEYSGPSNESIGLRALDNIKAQLRRLKCWWEDSDAALIALEESLLFNDDSFDEKWC